MRLCWGLWSADEMLLSLSIFTAAKIAHSSAMNGAPDLWLDLMYGPPRPG